MEEPRVPGPLGSTLFRGNLRLQQCAQFDRSHVQPNDPESPHVRKIQEALRQVFGAEISASEKNYGPDTVQAVLAFKADREIFTRGTQTVDPIVGINTIRKLDAILQGDDDRRKGRGGDGELGAAATVRPSTPIFGEVDRAGFSAARLVQTSAGAEWTSRDPRKPISQMIPVGQTRKLLVKSVGEAAVGFAIDREQIATITESDRGSVTLRGQAPGKARLTIAVEGQNSVRVDLVVLAARSIALDVFHLAPSRIANAAQTFQQALLPGLNRVYGPQANLTFTAGATRDVTVMVMDGASTVLDTDLPLFFSFLFGPPRANHPTIRFADLQREVKNANAVTAFISPNFRDEENANIAGRGGPGTKVCWFKLGLKVDASALTLPSHEIGHSLGLQHITVPKNETFLMHPQIQLNNTIIPSETLVDLMV